MKPKKNDSIASTNNISALNETTLLNWIETKWHNFHQSQFRTRGESHFIFHNIKHSVLWIGRLYHYRILVGKMNWLNNLWRPDVTYWRSNAVRLCWNHPVQCSAPCFIYFRNVHGIPQLTAVDNTLTWRNPVPRLQWPLFNLHTSSLYNSYIKVCFLDLCALVGISLQ